MSLKGATVAALESDLKGARSTGLRMILYIAFVLSGMAGLIYESIWTRYLGLFVGHSAYAQVIVLAVFLGGMALGAAATGQRSARLREPLLWYAGVELLAGILGLFFHQLYLAVTQTVYQSVFPSLAGSAALTVLKWAIAGMLILPQSILLGATFPLMSAGVLRRVPSRPGRVLAILYFSNSFGAAIGALWAGFFLVAWVGLPGTLMTAAFLNIAAAGLVYLVSRTLPRSAPFTGSLPSTPAETAALPSWLSQRTLWRLLLFLSFGTAVASFIYEVAWIRMLSLVLGSASHSFELMLSAFILGLALGAFWIRSRADRLANPMTALAVVQWVMGFAALATLPLYASSFDWMAMLLRTFARSDSGYNLFNVARYGICLAVMLPSTFCAGMTLPLITKILLSSGQGERAVGLVYGTNTFGSIVGVLLASLALLPWIGLKALLVTGATLDMLLGVVLFAVAQPAIRRRLLWSAASALSAAAAVSLVWQRVPLEPLLLSSGVFRLGRILDPRAHELLYYRDGRTASVSVARNLDTDVVFLSTNGKPDASLGKEWLGHPRQEDDVRALAADSATQALLALITLAHAPGTRTAAVIGHGSGMSSHFLLGSPALERLVTVEIEPEMIKASRAFYPANRRVFDDPRSVFAIEDAKAYFAARPHRYDLILSEPSNPWVSGVASLFTEEFYAQLAPLLSERGVFGQWLHLYELTDDLVLSVLSALHQSFRSYELYLLNPGDMLIVASNLHELPRPEWSVFQLPEITLDLARFAPFSNEHLDNTWIANRTVLAPLLDDWSFRNSDFFPVLDLGAEKARYRRSQAVVFSSLAQQDVHMVDALAGRRRPFSASPTNPIRDHPILRGRAKGAYLRSVDDASLASRSPDDPELRAASHRWWRWKAMLTSDQPPLDWREWLQDSLAVVFDLHNGTVGVVDEEFYAEVRRYLEDREPPAEVCVALRFTERLGRWDFQAAAESADDLAEGALNDRSWIPIDYLREAGTVSKLLSGDVEGARAFFKRLAPKARRPPDDLRSELLESWLLRPEGVAVQAAPPSGTSWRCRPDADSNGARRPPGPAEE